VPAGAGRFAGKVVARNIGALYRNLMQSEIAGTEMDSQEVEFAFAARYAKSVPAALRGL
jgi:hypothetical protein